MQRFEAMFKRLTLISLRKFSIFPKISQNFGIFRMPMGPIKSHTGNVFLKCNKRSRVGTTKTKHKALTCPISLISIINFPILQEIMDFLFGNDG